MDALAHRVIREPQTAEAQWRAWLDAERVPFLDADRCLRADDRLVVIAPHPDDEVLACGGLLSLRAQRGSECAVVAVTDGDASHEGCSDWNASSLAEARRSESERGLAQLGVPRDAITRLGIPDGAVQRHMQPLLDALCAHLRAGDVVISTWRLDGHPDHDATGLAAAKVCSALGARFVEAPVWMWHWSRPLDPGVPWERLRVLPLSPTMLSRKTSALAEHITQLTPRMRLHTPAHEAHSERPVLDPSILQRAAWPGEYFFV
jgi:LmbE family N-acetylglucosaminyl deacetylase